MSLKLFFVYIFSLSLFLSSRSSLAKEVLVSKTAKIAPGVKEKSKSKEENPDTSEKKGKKLGTFSLSNERTKLDRIMDFYAMALTSAKDLEDLARIFIFDESELNQVIKELGEKNLKASLLPSYSMTWEPKKRAIYFNHQGKAYRINMSFLEQLYVVIAGESFLIKTDMDVTSRRKSIASAIKDQRDYHGYLFAILLKGLSNLERACRPNPGETDGFCFNDELSLLKATRRLPKNKISSLICQAGQMQTIKTDQNELQFKFADGVLKAVSLVDSDETLLCKYTTHTNKYAYLAFMPEGMNCEGATPSSLAGGFEPMDVRLVSGLSVPAIIACGQSSTCCDGLKQ